MVLSFRFTQMKKNITILKPTENSIIFNSKIPDIFIVQI